MSAVSVIRRSVRLWRDPDSLKPDSWAYERYVAWLRADQRGKWKRWAQSAKAHWRYGDYDRFRTSNKWKDGYRPVKLTREDIVALARLTLIGGILMLGVGVATLVFAWLP